MTDPADFYTGLVAELYAPLRSFTPEPEPYARFIAGSGEPALELGCGDGDPLLALRRSGLAVEGLDASADMLERCRAKAAAEGLDVTLHQARIESMDLGRRFRSIFLAGPTFNLLVDDDTALAALERIAAHLEPGGSALIPLFVPEPTPPDQLGRTREHRLDADTVLAFSVVSEERDEARRRQTSLLRYERRTGDDTTVLERSWILHWYSQAQFADLVARTPLTVSSVLDVRGRPASPSDSLFVFRLELI